MTQSIGSSPFNNSEIELDKRRALYQLVYPDNRRILNRDAIDAIPDDAETVTSISSASFLNVIIPLIEEIGTTYRKNHYTEGQLITFYQLTRLWRFAQENLLLYGAQQGTEEGCKEAATTHLLRAIEQLMPCNKDLFFFMDGGAYPTLCTIHQEENIKTYSFSLWNIDNKDRKNALYAIWEGLTLEQLADRFFLQQLVEARKENLLPYQLNQLLADHFQKDKSKMDCGFSSSHYLMKRVWKVFWTISSNFLEKGKPTLFLQQLRADLIDLSSQAVSSCIDSKEWKALDKLLLTCAQKAQTHVEKKMIILTYCKGDSYNYWKQFTTFDKSLLPFILENAHTVEVVESRFYYNKWGNISPDRLIAFLVKFKNYTTALSVASEFSDIAEAHFESLLPFFESLEESRLDFMEKNSESFEKLSGIRGASLKSLLNLAPSSLSLLLENVSMAKEFCSLFAISLDILSSISVDQLAAMFKKFKRCTVALKEISKRPDILAIPFAELAPRLLALTEEELKQIILYPNRFDFNIFLRETFRTEGSIQLDKG